MHCFDEERFLHQFTPPLHEFVNKRKLFRLKCFFVVWGVIEYWIGVISMNALRREKDTLVAKFCGFLGLRDLCFHFGSCFIPICPQVELKLKEPVARYPQNRSLFVFF